jgi:TatD DNase family protein
MRLIDSHCHLQADRFEGEVDDVLARARAVGVERILVPGWDLASSQAAIQLVTRVPWLHAAVGIHPHDAGRADLPAWQGIVRLARDHRVVAIGETGLDFDRMFSPAPAQLENLRRHLDLGLELEKPVVIHCRSAAGTEAAHEAVIEALDAAGIRPPRREPTSSDLAAGQRSPALIHSFSGSLDFAREVLARGLAISISGLAFRAGEEATFAEIAPIVPGGRLLIETDSPYLSPPGAPRRRNEPEWVRITAERLATGRHTSPEQLGGDLIAGYDRTFGNAS